MRHQAQNGFFGISAEITQPKKGYLVYVPHRWKIIYLYVDGVYESFSSVLAYMSQPYAKAMDMRPAVSYILFAASSREQTGNIFTSENFEELNLISETCNDMEIGNEYDDN